MNMHPGCKELLGSKYRTLLNIHDPPAGSLQLVNDNSLLIMNFFHFIKHLLNIQRSRIAARIMSLDTVNEHGYSVCFTNIEYFTKVLQIWNQVVIRYSSRKSFIFSLLCKSCHRKLILFFSFKTFISLFSMSFR